MYRILYLIILLFVAALVLLFSPVAPIEEVAASQCIDPYTGQWDSDGNPSLVAAMYIQPLCGGPIGRGIGGDENLRGPVTQPMFHTVALCGSGRCDWGWSTGRYESAGFSDSRHWANGRTDQTIRLLDDGRLRVTTVVQLANGERREFSDTLRKTDGRARTTTRPVQYTVGVAYRVLWETDDNGSGGNEFRPRIIITRGGYLDQRGWQATTKTEPAVASVDVILRLMEEDTSGFISHDDHFDLEPAEGEKDLRLRVDLESGLVYRVRDWEIVEVVGRVGAPFQSEGRQGDDRARIEVLVATSPGRASLTLPAPAAAPAAPAAPAAAGVAFRLDNAETNQPALAMSGGAVVDLRTLPTQHLNVRVDFASPAVESVVFLLDGRPFCANGRCVENSPPYYMAGDVNGDPYDNWDWTTLLGTHTITAIPCEKDNGEPPCGAPQTVTFTVINR